MQSHVTKFLISNRLLDMTSVSRKLDEDCMFRADTMKRQAFAFLTKGATCLRVLEIDNNNSYHTQLPVASVNDVKRIIHKKVASVTDLKRLIRKNTKLEIVTLVNMKVTVPLMAVLASLPKIAYLKISPAMCPDFYSEKFSDMIAHIKKRGCKFVYHITSKEEKVSLLVLRSYNN
jgi:hypothetical protein